MRTIAVTYFLAASITWVGCHDAVNLGGKIKALNAGAGACSQNSDCGSSICDPLTNLLTLGSCSSGTCVAGTASACPGNLTCADASACRVSCAVAGDCVAGFYCSNGSCQAQLAAGGTCQSNAACSNGICGAAGSGHCCAAACTAGDALGCGATDCDATGACVYPNGTSCVALACTGHVLTEPAACNGTGSCTLPVPATIDCTPYACDATACKTTCSSTADCSSAFCATGVCCPAYAANTILVDGTTGVDQACCGASAGTGACATIAYAAVLARETGAVPATLSVANPPNGSDWTADAFPISLDQGVILNAPGIYFSNTSPVGDAGGQAIFLVSNLSAVSNPSPSVIEGSSTAPVIIGADSQGNGSLVQDHIVITNGGLDLLNAEIRFAAPGVVNGQTGIYVGDNATLAVGTDGQGASGTVWVGSKDNTGGSNGGNVGIWCGQSYFGLADAGSSSVNDTGSAASPSIWFENPNQAMVVQVECSVKLTGNPKFGPAPAADGTCDPEKGGLAGDFWGSTVLNNATIQCSRGLIAGGGGSFSGDNDVFEKDYVGFQSWGNDAGMVSLTNSTFRNNLTAMSVVGDTDLSGGGNSISCSEEVGILWYAGSTLNAENVAWDLWDVDAGHTEFWDCEPGAGGIDTCSCTGGSCPSDPNAKPVNGLPVMRAGDAYHNPVNTLDDTNGSLVSTGCN